MSITATSKIEGGKRTVTYVDDKGNKIVKIGGTVSWRNNNEGNLKIEPWKSQAIKDNWARSIGAIGVDQNGFAIFATEEEGRIAKENLLQKKYGDYNSIREMLKGKYDENGNYIPGTGYAPESDGNNPDAYADQIKKWTGLDVDNKKIKDLTPDEMKKLLDAMKRYEGWKPGSGYTITPDNKVTPLYPGIPGVQDIINKTKKDFNTASVTTSPIALDLDGDGIETKSLTDEIYFDHNSNGFSEKTGWLGEDDGLLVMDRDGNGRTELFGNQTILSNGQKASNGFEALAELDENKDGKIDASDAVYSQLRIWRDSDGDGEITYGVDENGQRTTDELFTLDELGIQSINTGYTDTNITDANGNTIKQAGSFTRTDGTTGNASDVWFKIDNMYSIANEWVDVPDDIAALPDLQGYGNVYDLHQAMARDESGELKSLVEQFMNETDAETRRALIIPILYKWTGVENIDPLSRAATKVYGKDHFRNEESLVLAGGVYA